MAVAHEDANAVGTIELSCSAHGLQLQFIRISAFTDGYVPYPVTSSLRATIPYEQVTRVTIDADRLVHLVLDPDSTPYNKLVLAGLVRDKQFDHAVSHRKRARIERQVTLAALGAWMPVALMLRVVWPDWSAWFVLALSATVSVVLHVIRKDLASKLVLFNRGSERVRDELLAELRWRLPAGRVLFSDPSEAPPRKVASAELGDAEPAEAGSLKGLFATAGIVTAAAAIAILVGKNLLFSTPAAPEAQWGQDTDEAWAWLDDDERPASTPVVPDRSSAPIGPDSTPPAQPPQPCACDRADSPLWADGIPRMSVLSSNRPGTTSPERPSVYPEIAVVNNSAEDLKDIVMVVDFILGAREGSKPRVVGKQDLFWEGRLAPGKAVKWRVRGRGDDFSVTSFVDGILDDKSVRAAPADAFHDLAMTANTPSVRLHGTAMLAYLGDERVHEALEKLRREASQDMADAIEQIDLAARPLRVCGVRATQAGEDAMHVEACVFNAGKEPVQSPTVTASLQRGEDVREGRWSLGTSLGPGMGARTSGRVSLPEAAPNAEQGGDLGVSVVAEKY